MEKSAPSFRSKKLINEARTTLAGGAGCRSRCFFESSEEIVIDYGKGSRLYDADGREYMDFCISCGVNILGHANHNVVLAAKKTAERGTGFSLLSRAEIEMAGFLTRHVPSMERVRFVNSGTEATLSAIRLAKKATERRKIVSFEGCYHGFHGMVPVEPRKESLDPAGLNIVLPYNNAAAFREAVESNHREIACVIIEPVAAHMGIIPGDKDFLTAIREITRRYGILLIFDETMTAFRGFAGGFQSNGIVPDITCMGGVIGGGFSLGVYGGRADIMRSLSPEGSFYQSPTIVSQTVLRAGLMALRLMNDAFYKAVNKKAEYLVSSLNDVFIDHNLSVRVFNYYSMMSLVFSTARPSNYEESEAVKNPLLYQELGQYLLGRGIIIPQAEKEPFFISGKHSRKDLDIMIGEVKTFFLGKKDLS
ncbi:MAG: aspartate aminotransferase family protein [Candidatus Omnitrophota bacterium]